MSEFWNRFATEETEEGRLLDLPEHNANMPTGKKVLDVYERLYVPYSALLPPSPESVLPTVDTVKMDTIESFSRFVPGTYLVTTLRRAARKMDAIRENRPVMVGFLIKIVREDVDEHG